MRLAGRHEWGISQLSARPETGYERRRTTENTEERPDRATCRVESTRAGQICTPVEMKVQLKVVDIRMVDAARIGASEGPALIVMARNRECRREERGPTRLGFITLKNLFTPVYAGSGPDTCSIIELQFQ